MSFPCRDRTLVPGLWGVPDVYGSATPGSALCAMSGIPDFHLLCAEGLDDVRNDKAALLAGAMAQAEALAPNF